MAALLGEINERYLADDSASPLRAVLGNSFYSDVVPRDEHGGVPRPYVVVEEANTTPFGHAKGIPSPRILDITVGFNVYGNSRPQVEFILERLEAIFLETGDDLTVDNRQWVGVMFGNRSHTWDGEGWFGRLELVYRLRKN